LSFTHAFERESSTTLSALASAFVPQAAIGRSRGAVRCQASRNGTLIRRAAAATGAAVEAKRIRLEVPGEDWKLERSADRTKSTTHYKQTIYTNYKPQARGGRKNKTRKRRTSAPARKKSTYVPFFFFFSAFLGVSRQGEFKTRENKLSAFQKKSPGKYFFGVREDFFLGDFFQLLFLSIFLLRWLSASR
jgi:hypothetical protein